MKFLITLCLIPLLSFTLINERLNSCNGFDKFVFGAPKESFKDLVLEIEEGDSRLYTIDPKSISVPGVEFEYIRVSFIKNKLATIAMLTKDSTRGAFFQILKANYGTPSKTNRNYEWIGKNVRIIYEPYKKGGEAAIDFYCRK